SCGCDRLDDGLALRALEIGKLGFELLALRGRELLTLFVGHALVTAAAGAAAATTAAATTGCGRLREPVYGERGELARHVRGTAVGAGDLLVAADELFEVRLALHADVLVDRHRSRD